MQYKLRVSVEGIDPYDVVADQRDAARWEMLFGLSTFDAIKSRPLAFQRWLGYSAGKRAKRIDMTWDEFEEKCLEVSTADNGGEDESDDPGQTAA